MIANVPARIGPNGLQFSCCRFKPSQRKHSKEARHQHHGGTARVGNGLQDECRCEEGRAPLMKQAEPIGEDWADVRCAAITPRDMK